MRPGNSRALLIYVFGAISTLLVGSGPAAAIATVSVSYSGWDIYFDYYSDANVGGSTFFDTIPEGLAFTCTGGASQGGVGCSDERSLEVSSSAAGVHNFSVTANSGFSLTNTTQENFPGYFVFDTDFSAFNPGGPEIGASVTDPNSEYAIFNSSVSGPGVYDNQGCDTRNYPSDSENNFSPYACGVPSPDGSSSNAYLGPLGPGETISVDYTISISAQLKSVPEPISLSIFAAGLIGMLYSARIADLRLA